MLRLVARADRLVLFANLFLLLTVSVIPFPTRVLAEYLTEGHADSHTAAALYSASMLLLGVAFTCLFLAVCRDDRLLHQAIDRATVRATLRRFSVGTVAYLITVGLSFVSAVVTLIAHGLLAIYYCFDQLAPARTAASDGTTDR